MFTNEKVQLDEIRAALWVKSFTEEINENEEIKIYLLLLILRFMHSY